MHALDEKSLLKGATEVIGWDDLAHKVKAGKKLRIKHGIDPTAPDLHLGYAVVYTVLRRFQDLGHTVIFLLGDFTTGVGDPTDKDVTRPQLTEEKIKENVQSCLAQIGKILDLEKLEVRYNSEWWNGTTLKEFMGIATKISAARLWERDMFERRLEHGGSVAVHEFLYPILQGYDSVMLESDATVIGTDQKFNELMGRELQEEYGQSPQALIMMPLLRGTDGVRKMGQSLNNYIGISETASEQYGKLMSIPDELMPEYFELLTDARGQDIEERMRDTNVNPRDIKMELARTIVGRMNGEREAVDAENRFVEQFQKGTINDAPEVSVGMENISVVDALMMSGLATSKTDARRVIDQGGVSIGDDGVASADMNIHIPDEGVLLRKGRHYKKLVK